MAVGVLPELLMSTAPLMPLQAVEVPATAGSSAAWRRTTLGGSFAEAGSRGPAGGFRDLLGESAAPERQAGDSAAAVGKPAIPQAAGDEAHGEDEAGREDEASRSDEGIWWGGRAAENNRFKRRQTLHKLNRSPH